MRTTLLSVTLGFLLACAGALNSLTPDLPFTIPPGSNTTGVNVNTTNGVSSTQVSFASPDVDPAALQDAMLAELIASSWSVNATPGSLSGTRGEGESLVITIAGASAGGSSVDVVWTKP